MARSRNQYLYRITTFDRLVEMLEENELYFAHPSSWQDPYETKLTHRDSKNIYGLCWCKVAVSDAIWRIYSPNSLGVRIRTSRARLSEALATAKVQHGIHYNLDDVAYDNAAHLRQRLAAIATELSQGFTFETAVKPLFMKRYAFRHEHEVRAVVHKGAHGAAAHGSYRLKVDARRLIDNILVDPRAPDEFVDAFSHYFKGKLRFPGNVSKSKLYAPGEAIAAATDASAELAGEESPIGQGNLGVKSA